MNVGAKGELVSFLDLLCKAIAKEGGFDPKGMMRSWFIGSYARNIPREDRNQGKSWRGYLGAGGSKVVVLILDATQLSIKLREAESLSSQPENRASLSLSAPAALPWSL